MRSDDILHFPSHLIKPESKGEDYVRRYMKATHQRFKTDQHFFTYSRRKDFITNRRYAEGNQDTEKYKKWSSKVTNDQGQRVGYADLDFSIVSTIPKMRDIVMGYLEKIEYDIGVNAVNPEAEAERESYMARIWAIRQLLPFFQQQEQNAGVTLTNFGDSFPFIPETKEELELFKQMSFKLRSEISRELAIQLVLGLNKWLEIAKQVWEDLFDNGIAACEVLVDPLTGEIKTKYIDCVNLILQSSRHKNFKDIERIGYIDRYTISDLRMLAGDQIPKEGYIEIANSVAGRHGNPDRMFSIESDYINTDDYEYDSYVVNVMRLYWDSVDRMKHEKKKTDYGEEYVFDVPFEKKSKKTKNREVFHTDVKTVYHGNWIIGTDYVFKNDPNGTWKLNDISRPSDNPKEVIKPIHVYRVSNKSHLERALPFADAMQLTHLKIQNAKAKARPKGLKIEVGALENVNIDGKDYPALQLLEIYDQTGNIIYRGTGYPDDPDQNDSSRFNAVQETQGGMGNEFVELVQDLNNNIRMMQEVTGINEIVAASNPNPKMPVRTSEMMVDAAHNSLQPLLSGFMTLKEEVCRDILEKIQVITQYRPIKGVYKDALGSSVMKTLEISKDANIYGLIIKRRASEQDKYDLIEAAKEALKGRQQNGQGGINYADYLAITNIIKEGGNIKLAEQLFLYRIEQRKKEDDQRQKETIELQGKQAMQQDENKKKSEKDLVTHKTNEAIRQHQKKVDDLIRLSEEEKRHKAKIEIPAKGEEDRKTTEVGTE